MGRWTCMQWYDLNNLEWIVGLFLNGPTILKIEWLVGLLFAFFLSIMYRERMNISNSYSPTSVTIGASYTFEATIGSKQGSGSNSNYHQPFVAERRGLKDRNRIHQADGKALSIGVHCSQRLGTVCQMMTFIKHVSKD